MKRYVVMHNYGCEGWRIMAETDSMLEAARARESEVRNGGGDVEIFEYHTVFAAYRMADYLEDQERRAKERAPEAVAPEAVNHD